MSRQSEISNVQTIIRIAEFSRYSEPLVDCMVQLSLQMSIWDNEFTFWIYVQLCTCRRVYLTDIVGGPCLRIKQKTMTLQLDLLRDKTWTFKTTKPSERQASGSAGLSRMIVFALTKAALTSVNKTWLGDCLFPFNSLCDNSTPCTSALYVMQTHIECTLQIPRVDNKK